MQIKALHQNFIMPTSGSELAGAFDVYMPEDGKAYGNPVKVGLGFAATIPPGYVALLVPRSGVGAKHGVELNNTCGVIDADYRGEWKAVLRTKDGRAYEWKAGDRVLQFMVVPVWKGNLELVEELSETDRGAGGFGSTNK